MSDDLAALPPISAPSDVDTHLAAAAALREQLAHVRAAREPAPATAALLDSLDAHLGAVVEGDEHPLRGLPDHLQRLEDARAARRANKSGPAQQRRAARDAAVAAATDVDGLLAKANEHAAQANALLQKLAPHLGTQRSVDSLAALFSHAKPVAEQRKTHVRVKPSWH